MKIRYIIDLIKYRKKIKNLGKKSIIIKYPSSISNFDKITFGTNVYIGPQAIIMARGGLKVGSNIRIGPRVSIWTENHNYKEELLPYGYNDISKTVVIEDNVWIGLGVIINPGTTIREGAIIAMGSVVRGDLESGGIYAGNPAVKIGKRNMKEYKQSKELKKFHQLK